MKIPIRLFIRRHTDQTYTVSVPGLAGVETKGESVEQCKAALEAQLPARLAELTPHEHQMMAARRSHRLKQVTVELRPAPEPPKRRRDRIELTISLLLMPGVDGQYFVTAPRLAEPPLQFYWSDGDDLTSITQIEIAHYFHDTPADEILAHQADPYETIDELEIEFQPQKAARTGSEPANTGSEEQEVNSPALQAAGFRLTAPEV
jgi:hypothetical protein